MEKQLVHIAHIIVACTLSILISIQWHAHIAVDAVSFWFDFVPLVITFWYIFNKLDKLTTSP